MQGKLEHVKVLLENGGNLLLLARVNDNLSNSQYTNNQYHELLIFHFE